MRIELVATHEDHERIYSAESNPLSGIELATAVEGPLLFVSLARVLVHAVTRRLVHDVRSKAFPPPQPPLESPDTPPWLRGKGF